MNPQPLIAVIGSLSTDQILTTDRMPDPGESLKSSGFFVRCGGKGANTSVAAYRLSRQKETKVKQNEVASAELVKDDVPKDGIPNEDILIDGIPIHDVPIDDTPKDDVPWDIAPQDDVAGTGLTAAAAPASATAPADEGVPRDEGGKIDNQVSTILNGLSNDDELARAEKTVIQAVAQPDIKVSLIGAIGNDDRGSHLLKTLTQRGVDTSGVRSIDGVDTGLCICIIMSETGENRLLLVPGANLALRPDDFLTMESLAGGPRPDLVICQLVIPRDTVEKILETATTHKIDTLLNPSPAQYLLRPVYKMITHLVVNETEAAILTDRSLEDLAQNAGRADVTDRFLKMGVQNVVVTLGAEGAYYSNKIGEGGHVEAVKDVHVVDVTGAGDTFTGAYAAEVVRQKKLGRWDIRKAVEYGCKASARTIQQIGAQESIPWANEVDFDRE